MSDEDNDKDFFFDILKDKIENDEGDESNENDEEEYKGDPNLKPILKCEKKLSAHSDSVENVKVFHQDI
jgi:hypothetical protein